MPFTLAALKTELQTDPRGYGYAAALAAGNHEQAATILNTIRDGTNPPANPTAAGGTANGRIRLNRGAISADELANAIVYSEYIGGQAAPRQYIDMLMTLPQIPTDPGSNPRVGLETIFGAATQTRANLGNAALKDSSRAEELFGIFFQVSAGQVGDALKS